MNPKILRLLHGEVIGPVTVGSVRSGIASGRGAADNNVWLSRDTLMKQLRHHPDLLPEFYEDLGWLLLYGHALFAEKCFYIVGAFEPDSPNLFKATLKVVRANRRIMLLSVHRIRESDFRRLARKCSQ